MAVLTNYAANKILDHANGKTAWTMPTTVYIGLFTSNPGDDVSGTEVAGNGYARVAYTVDASASRATQNAAAITFAAADAAWGTITHFCTFDALTTGNGIIYGALTANVAVTADDIFSFADEALDMAAS
jgi:hypothetical protein